MAQRTRLLSSTSVVALSFLSLATPASAQRVYLTSPLTLYAHPSGSGNVCSQSIPCQPAVALDVACTNYDYGTTAGPTIQLMSAPGLDYSLPHKKITCAYVGKGQEYGFHGGIITRIVGDPNPGAPTRDNYTIQCGDSCLTAYEGYTQVQGVTFKGLGTPAGTSGYFALQALQRGIFHVWDVGVKNFQGAGQIFGAGKGGAITFGTGAPQSLFVDTSMLNMLSCSNQGRFTVSQNFYFTFTSANRELDTFITGEGMCLVEIEHDILRVNGAGASSVKVTNLLMSCGEGMVVYTAFRSFPNPLGRPTSNDGRSDC